jgi:tRNA-specific 2-thiouridylase
MPQNAPYAPFRQIPHGARILMAFSGGVDSAVAASLALRAGYRVTAVHMTLLPGDGSAREKAEETAKKIGIELIHADCSEVFERAVLRPSWDMYKFGFTPNPCAICNPAVKFGSLMPLMEQHGCTAFATGHYAKAIDAPDGGTILARGSYREKDQSYFLFGLSQEQLARIVFPLGGMTKPEVREIARGLGLPNAESKESQDACFMPPDRTAAEFLHEHFGETVPCGTFAAASDGRILGRHDGIYAYTIGQRKGTGVAMGVPAWVSRIDAAENKVWLTTDPDDLLRDAIVLPCAHWIAKPAEAVEFRAQVQIRYRSRPTDASVLLSPNGVVFIHFDAPQRAVTPGQAAVIYDGDRLLGGGWIP